MSMKTRWKIGDGMLPAPFDGIGDIFQVLLDQVNDLSPEWLSARTGNSPMEVTVNDDEVVVKLPLPGCKSDGISVEVLGDILTVTGQRKEEYCNSCKGNYLRREIAVNEFEESMTLPVKVSGQDATASYEEGVLTVELPRDDKNAVRTHRVNVK